MKKNVFTALYKNVPDLTLSKHSQPSFKIANLQYKFMER